MSDLIKISVTPEVKVCRDFTVYDAEKVVATARRILAEAETTSTTTTTPSGVAVTTVSPPVRQRGVQGANFLRSISDFYRNKGFISPRQYAVAVDILNKNALAEVSVEFPAPEVEPAFEHATAGKDAKVKVHIVGYTLRRCFSTRFNSHYIAVYAEDFGFVGSIANGAFKAAGKAKAHGYDFSDLENMLKNFKDAVRAYGRLTNNCGVCRRALTDPISVERGIGPICESRMGW